MTDIVEQFDNMVGHIISINDERDVLQLLLGLKDLWPQVRAEIERLRTESNSQKIDDAWNEMMDRRDIEIERLRAKNRELASLLAARLLERWND